MEPVKLNVTCVIPNYNGEHLLAKNLPRLLVASKNKRNKIRQIVVVDDASTDGSLKLLREEFPDVVVVKNKVNRGFSATVNAGVKVAKEEIILLLNNDVLVTDNFLEDIDLSYRALKRGYRLLWHPSAKVLHKHETTYGKVYARKSLQLTKEVNQLTFIWKNLTSGNLFRKHVFGLFSRLRKHPGYLRVVIMALTKARIIRRARKKEKKEGSVSDEAIFAKFTDFR